MARKKLVRRVTTEEEWLEDVEGEDLGDDPADDDDLAGAPEEEDDDDAPRAARRRRG